MKIRVLLAVSFLLILAIAGCGGNEQEGTGTTEEQDTAEQQQGNDQEQKTEQEAEEPKQITIGLDPYDYATVPAYLSQEILEQQGYEVKIQEGQVGMLFQALADGEIDAFIDIWSPNLHASYLKEFKGDFEVVGTLYSDTPLGIAVPSYMKNVNSIPDLKKYREKFGGTIYAIDAGSGMDLTTRKMIKEYDMKFEVVNSSTPAMVAQATKVMDDKGAIAFNAWRPHTMFKLLDIKLLKDPKNVWKSDDVRIGVVPDLKERQPTAYTLFSNMELTYDEIEKWLVAMESEDKSPEELAKAWVKEHADRVNKWLEK